MFFYGPNLQDHFHPDAWSACLQFAGAFDWEPAFEDISRNQE